MEAGSEGTDSVVTGKASNIDAVMEGSRRARQPSLCKISLDEFCKRSLKYFSRLKLESRQMKSKFCLGVMLIAMLNAHSSLSAQDQRCRRILERSLVNRGLICPNLEYAKATQGWMCSHRSGTAPFNLGLKLGFAIQGLPAQ